MVHIFGINIIGFFGLFICGLSTPELFPLCFYAGPMLALNVIGYYDMERLRHFLYRHDVTITERKQDQ